jgi:hypothetical protein
MNVPSAPVSLAGSSAGEPRHVCAFFADDEEEYGVLLPFVKEGLDGGDRAIHVLHPGQHADHLDRLAAAGIDTEAAVARGQLELRASTDTYLREGCFDVERMLALFEQIASDGGRDEFPRSRIVCRMDWALEGRVPIEDVIEFEARVNHVWCRHDDAVICTYPLAQLGAGALMDILRTHPLVIVAGLLQRNPFFVPPERFLPEFRERRAKRRTHQP